jgi:7-carboxy-7-deazaguanine synthase
MKYDNKLAVSEYFYSLQGEGRTIGIPAFFIRLTGCNLMCGGYGVEKDGELRDGATWKCDTIDVWMKGTTYTFEQLTDLLINKFDFINLLNNQVHLVFTGGEPLLQQDRIVSYLEFLKLTYNCNPVVEIETNATFLPTMELDSKVSYWNCSPKLRNSGMSFQLRIKNDILLFFKNNDKTMFKFVVSDIVDFDEIKTDFLETNLIDKRKIVLMPAADSLDKLLTINKMVAEICINNQLRMSTRLHVEIWNQLTGV